MTTESTRWSMIRGAAEGSATDREEFARRYASIIRAYLGHRWRHSPLIGEMDDAVQDVFLACFKDGGVLERADAERPGGFRAYLHGVTRNVARRAEEKRRLRRERNPGSGIDLGYIEANEDPLSRVFDMAWARSVIQQASALQAEQASAKGRAAQRRVELLRLRFGDDMPIREIARAWGEDPARVHTEYARARREFKAALTEIVRTYQPGRSAEAECARLLRLFR